MKKLEILSDLLCKIQISQILKDPFPEHTLYTSLVESGALMPHNGFLTSFVALFSSEHRKNLDSQMKPPKKISIHEAYKCGYDQAYTEINKGLKAKSNLLLTAPALYNACWVLVETLKCNNSMPITKDSYYFKLIQKAINQSEVPE